MTLPIWWQVVTLHKGIREGNLSESDFACDIGDVASGNASEEYTDPVTFFGRTFITQGLKTLLENVLTRMSGGKGDGVIQLQTPFGGGKTHSLLALYHIINNRSQINDIKSLQGLPTPKNPKITIFNGTKADALKGKTPWGELGHQLGKYAVIKDHDIQKVSPGKDVLEKLFGDEPVLILMDELVPYCVNAGKFYSHVMTFIQAITELVKSKKNVCLICTLPSSTSSAYGPEGERALSDLQKILGRMETIYTPVEGVEIYGIVRKRLFTDLGPESERKKVAQKYFDVYKNLGKDIPPEASDIGYRTKIEHAYPFHPELIDVLHERWGAYETFQRTRGALRLLAEVVSDLYSKRVPYPLIQSSHVDLRNKTIRSELLKHIGNSYESVITSDIASEDAHAINLNKTLGSEYEKYNVASNIATSVFMYSFNATGKVGTSLPYIRLSVLTDSIPSMMVVDTINKIEEELWYFHAHKGTFSFKKQPNINRIIIDKEGGISDERIQDELRSQIEDIAGKEISSYIWPEQANDIPDDRDMKLVILNTNLCKGEQPTNEFAKEIFEKAGTGFRIYKNCLFLLAADKNLVSAVKSSIRRNLSLQDLKDDDNIVGSLEKEAVKEIDQKFARALSDVSNSSLSCYRHLAYLSENGIKWVDLGIPATGVQTLSYNVESHLIKEDKLLDNIDPRLVLSRTLGKDEDQKKLSDIYELFLKTPGFELLRDSNTLINSVKRGAKSIGGNPGAFGVQTDETVYLDEPETTNFDVSLESILMKRNIAEKKKSSQPAKPGEPASQPTTTPTKPQPAKVGPKKIQQINFKASIPWDKMNDFMRYIIIPLNERGKPPKISIEVSATTEDSYDDNLINNRIKETLRQIKAEQEYFKAD